MSTIAAALRPIPLPKPDTLRRDPAAQAFMLLRIAFTVAPILFGLDKFAEVMIGDWPKYLAPEFNDIIPGSAQDAMYIVGASRSSPGWSWLVIPRFGGLLVAGWLGGIIVSLLLVGGYARHRAARLRPAGRRAGALPPGKRARGASLSNAKRAAGSECSPRVFVGSPRLALVPRRLSCVRISPPWYFWVCTFA